MSTTLTDAAVDIRGLSKRFDDKAVLTDVDLRIEAGEFVAIVGQSGCGKSTLLRIIAGIEDASAGVVTHVAPVAVAFQDSRLVPWQKVWRNVVFGVEASRKDLRQRARAVLAEVGLTEHEEDWPHTLSGGQAQRVSLARALTVDPRLLLLDEPFGALDALTRLKAQALVSRLWLQHGFTVALVTHDVEEAVVLADRVIVITDGGIAADIRIELARPRTHTDHRVTDYKASILALLGIDTSLDR